METTIYILNAVGTIALFVYGMKVLSEGLQYSFGRSLWTYLDKAAKKKPHLSILSGLFFTGIVQSSSVSSVLILSYVNSGILGFKRAFSAILGINIGATTTVWFVYLGLILHFEYISLFMIAIGTPFLFSRKSSRRSIGSIILGISMVFVSVYVLEWLIGIINQNSEFYLIYKNFIQRTSFLDYLTFLLLGAIITIIFKFSTVFIIIVMLFISKGMLLETALFLVLGSNIGTTFTAIMTSIKTNKQAKVVAYFHFWFNFIGAIIFFPLIPILSDSVFAGLDPAFCLVLFHTLFNLTLGLLTLAIMIIFDGRLQKIYNKYKMDDITLKPIDYPFGLSGDLYVYESSREIIKFAHGVKQILSILTKFVIESDEEAFEERRQRLLYLKRENNKYKKGIKKFLYSIYDLEALGGTSRIIQVQMSVCHHLESVGELALRITLQHDKRLKTNSYITPKMRNKLMELHELLAVSCNVLNKNMNDFKQVDAEEIKIVRKEFKKLYKKTVRDVEKAAYKEKIPKTSIFLYKEIISQCDNINFHLYKANKELLSLSLRNAV